MKIAVITPNFPPTLGGISHTTKSLYDFLSKEHEVFVFNNLTEDLSGNILNLIDNQGSIKLNFESLKKSWKLIKTLLFKSKAPFFMRLTPFIYFLRYPRHFFKLINTISALSPYFIRENFDFVVSMNIGNASQIAFLISEIFKKKLIILAHGDDFLANMRRINHYINTAFVSNANILIFSNEIMRDLFMKMFPKLAKIKSEIVNRGIRQDESILKKDKMVLRKELNIPTENFILISLGRLVLRKNFQSVIEAMGLLKNERDISNFTYLIIGEGPALDDLRKKISQHKLEKNITLLGGIKGNDLKNKYLKVSDVFIMNSYYDKKAKSIEGFGINFLEANYYKLPVIGSFSGGIPKAIENGKSGFLVKSNDVEGLKNVIKQLIDDDSLRKNIGDYGHKRTVEKYTWDTVHLEYLRIFKELLD